MDAYVIGKLYRKYDTEIKLEKYKKREFILQITQTIIGNVYINYAKFQLNQNQCEIIDRFDEGDSILVYYNIKGNIWTSKGVEICNTILQAWRIEKQVNE